MRTPTTKQLEKSMIGYRDLTGIPVADNRESVATLDPEIIPNGYFPKMLDMSRPLKNSIILRKTVIHLLQNAQARLKMEYEKYSLYVTYGYRSLEVQTTMFRRVSSQIAHKRFFSDPVNLYEETHRFIAVPTVAGHPTGGAIDVGIIDKSNRFVDFGSAIYDFKSKACYVFKPQLRFRARQNRILLRTCMMGAGFAPFDGEWWHFSYGDCEWARYYNKPTAIYDQLSLHSVKQTLRIKDNTI